MNQAHAHWMLCVCVCASVWILLFFCAQWIESIKQGGTLYSEYSSIYHFPMGRSTTTTMESQHRGCNEQNEKYSQNKNKHEKQNTQKKIYCIHFVNLHTQRTSINTSLYMCTTFIENAYVHVFCAGVYKFFFHSHSSEPDDSNT